MAKYNQHSLGALDKSTLLAILKGTASETGERFFAALVENLAKALNTYGAWVTEYLEESQKLRALAFWLGGQFVSDYEYDIAGTPCEPVIVNTRLVHIPDNVIALYPNDPDLPKVGAVSYMGVPLLDLDGRILGHLAILHNRPMPEEPQALAIFRIFASRASAELQRLRAETEIHQREEELSLLFNSAMDAIIELDHNLKVTRVNTAAEKVLKCPREKIVSQDFAIFLKNEDSKKISYLVKELDSHPEDRRYMWIPGGLKAICADGEGFQAEATISQFKINKETFYTLILRSVNERLEAERKIHSLTVESEYLKEEIKALHNFDEIIGKSKPMLRVMRDIVQVAETNATVLILGETGTGKELIARAIHASSQRRDKPLIKVNCAAIPSALIESELFGHEKGAFTGAISKRDGRFALADRGTFFLDEIGELSLDLQAKLLHVLQEGEFEPVGSSQTRKVDVRVIAATNRDLHHDVQNGRFREDLFYRLNVFPIVVPPLRERRDDIPLLASAFAKTFAQKMGRTIDPLSQEDAERLKSYDWPGNVRELLNVIERSVITSRGGKLNLDRALPETAKDVIAEEMVSPEKSTKQVLKAEELQKLEKKNIINALEASGWKIAGENGAARLLGIPPSTLNSRMKALGIKRS
jgi:PAS domain S-box-containing protein